MSYKTFAVIASFDGSYLFLDVVAVDIAAAIADVTAAYGDFKLIQWGIRG